MPVLYRKEGNNYCISKGRGVGVAFLSTVTNDSTTGTSLEWSRNPLSAITFPSRELAILFLRSLSGEGGEVSYLHIDIFVETE